MLKPFTPAEDDDDDASHSQATVDASESSRMEDSVADTDYLITSPSLRQSLQTFAALSTRYASQCDIVKQLHDDLVSSYLKPLSKSNAVQSTVAVMNIEYIVIYIVFDCIVYSLYRIQVLLQWPKLYGTHTHQLK